MNTIWRRLVTAVVFVMISCNCHSQSNDFDFLLQKIQLDYPGFYDKTDSTKFALYAKKVLTENTADTFKAMSIVVNSFKDKHLQVYQLRQSLLVDKNVCTRNFQDITKYLNTPVRKAKYEGYWVNDYNSCVIGLKRSSRLPLEYKAYVIESLDSLLPPGRVLDTYSQIDKNTFLTDHISVYSKVRYFITTTFRNDSVFTTGAEGKWKKITHYSKPLLPNLPKFNYTASSRAVNDSVYLITIPGSTQQDGKVIDSLVKADSAKIASSKTLIIDLRNNLGGRSGDVKSLWPFLYTRPIVRHQVATYCTEDDILQNMAELADYRKQSDADTSVLNEWDRYFKMERDSIGRFIVNNADIMRYDQILPSPKNVGIIINYANQSAAELILLMAKQSSKVRLFGEHTMGAVDYLDFYGMPLPSKRYKFYVATTKRIIPKEGKKLDGVGIYPDVRISDSINDWVAFVVKYYATH